MTECCLSNRPCIACFNQDQGSNLRFGMWNWPLDAAEGIFLYLFRCYCCETKRSCLWKPHSASHLLFWKIVTSFLVSMWSALGMNESVSQCKWFLDCVEGLKAFSVILDSLVTMLSFLLHFQTDCYIHTEHALHTETSTSENNLQPCTLYKDYFLEVVTNEYWSIFYYPSLSSLQFFGKVTSHF